MMKINPYTGEPLPKNQYTPLIIDPKPLKKYQPIGITDERYMPNVPTNIPNPTDSILNDDNKIDLGADLKANAGSILSFGAEQYSNFKNTAGSTKESQAQMISGTMKGAALGMSVGGPVGAAVGGFIGAGVNYLDMKHDQKKRADASDKDHREMLGDVKDERARSYQMQKGEHASANTMNTYGKQQKYYNPYG